MTTVSELMSVIRGRYVGRDAQVSGVNSLERAAPWELTFYTGSKIPPTNSKVIICKEGMIPLGNDTYILADNPRLEFIRVARRFFAPSQPDISGITGINWNVVTIGSRVTIGSNCSIGYDGFGYERDTDGKLLLFPHYGGVIIEDDVDIGCNVCIDRGTFGDTIIGEGTKIDNLVHIAHNVKIGKNCLIIAQSIICGSVTIEDNVWVAPHVSIKDGVTIGEGSVLGLAANVLDDVEPYSVMVGNPARRLRSTKESS